MSILDQQIREPQQDYVVEVEAPSPFLPDSNIQFAWDATSLSYLKQCPRLYKYIMIDGWQSEGESIHLRFGQELHIALQQYYISRAADIPHDDAVHDVIHELLIRTWGWNPDTTERPGKYKNRHSLVRAVIDYVDGHIDDQAKTYIKNDGTAAVEYSFRFELDFGPKAAIETVNGEETLTQPYVLCGHLDRIVEFNDAIFVEDYKTTTSTPGPYYFDQYDPNNQMSLYTLAGQIVTEEDKARVPVKGVIIDAIQLLTDESRSVRGLTYRTQGRIDEWCIDLGYWLGMAEYYASINYWPHNDTACDKFGGCRFREICQKDPSVREKFLESNFKRGTPWNPLQPR